MAKKSKSSILSKPVTRSVEADLTLSEEESMLSLLKQDASEARAAVVLVNAQLVEFRAKIVDLERDHEQEKVQLSLAHDMVVVKLHSENVGLRRELAACVARFLELNEPWVY
jgi:hypothetical protein